MSVALIALGANLGPREETLRRSLELLAQDANGESQQVSRFYESTSIGGPAGQPAFLNAAVRLETSLSPAKLLTRLQEIETKLGRERHQRWDARTIDLDLLLYDEIILETPTLTVPHPRLAFRRFMLDPAAEIAPGMRHPSVGMSLSELAVHAREAFPLVAVHAADAELAVSFARDLAAATGGQLELSEGGRLPGEALAGWPESAAVEFIELRARELAALSCRNSAQPVIVPYWLEALRRQAAERVGSGVEIGRAAMAVAMQPKLLVWLESSAAPFHQPHRLPAVRANAHEISQASEEAAAAVLAMQTPVSV